MAPSRLRCLNATRQITRTSLNLRAAFSTSQVIRAEDPPKKPSNSTADLLAAITNDLAPSRPTSSFSIPTPNPKPWSPPSFSRPSSSPPPSSSRAPKPGNYTANSRVQALIRGAEDRRARQEARSSRPGLTAASSTAEDMEKHKLSADLSRQITRRWKAGDVYAPHDLSAVEMRKWKNRGRPVMDVFDVLDFDPIANYRNFSIMSEYMTPMGRIKHSKETGLRPVNQRRIARAIRRSIGIGMMPSVHRHPEILQQTARRPDQISPYRRGPL